MHGRDSESPHLPPDDVATVTTRIVACDGGEGPLGHPRIYMRLAPRQVIQCPYCSRRYVLAADAGTGGP